MHRPEVERYRSWENILILFPSLLAQSLPTPEMLLWLWIPFSHQCNPKSLPNLPNTAIVQRQSFSIPMPLQGYHWGAAAYYVISSLEKYGGCSVTRVKNGVDIGCLSQPWYPTYVMLLQQQRNPQNQWNSYLLHTGLITGRGWIVRCWMFMPLLEDNCLKVRG